MRRLLALVLVAGLGCAQLNAGNQHRDTNGDLALQWAEMDRSEKTQTTVGWAVAIPVVVIGAAVVVCIIAAAGMAQEYAHGLGVGQGLADTQPQNCVSTPDPILGAPIVTCY